MAEDQIAEKSAARKRTALLGLATETKAGAGECLNPEAMAAFVSGYCTAEEKQEALRHISLCRRCYGEWLVLMELRLDSGRRQRRAEKIPFYLKPANLAALVSAMAAVICVGLFLDINPFGYRIDGEPVPVATMRQESATPPAAGDQAEGTTEAPSRSRQADKATRSEQIPSASDRKTATGTMDRNAVEPSSPALKSAAPAPAVPRPEAAPPPPAESDLQAEPAAPTEERESAGGRDPMPLPLSLRQWHQELTAVCRDREGQRAGRMGLDDLFRAGKRALPAWRRQSPSSPADRSLQQRLLPLLDQFQDMEQLLARCPEILAAGGTTAE